MRVNMRVGKRFGDSEYDDEAPKRRLRLRVRTGKRTPEQDYTETQLFNTILDTDTLNHEQSQENEWAFLKPNRRLRLIFRPGKRNFGNPEQAQFYGEPNPDGNFQDNYLTAPKRRLRMIMRTGKRGADNTKNTPTTLQPPIQLDTEPEDVLPEPHSRIDYKRSSPQFLLNPRIGKNDKTWKIRPLDNLSKRSDPKATDLWFGPRIGRSNDEQFEEIPWNYIILNGNRLPNPPSAYKSNEAEQSNEEPTD